jgi:hypothetical protein
LVAFLSPIGSFPSKLKFALGHFFAADWLVSLKTKNWPQPPAANNVASPLHSPIETPAYRAARFPSTLASPFRCPHAILSPSSPDPFVPCPTLIRCSPRALAQPPLQVQDKNSQTLPDPLYNHETKTVKHCPALSKLLAEARDPPRREEETLRFCKTVRRLASSSTHNLNKIFGKSKNRLSKIAHSETVITTIFKFVLYLARRHLYP